MEDLLKESVKSVPSLGIFAGVAIFSLKALLKFMESRDAFIKMMHDEHLAARESSRDAIDNNARMTQQNNVALDSLQSAIQSLQGVIERQIIDRR